MQKAVVVRIKNLSASERKITAEILTCIREIDLQKIHLEMGYPSLMDFLVQECGYSETSALRRIDAARIMNLIPEIQADLKNGTLNLSQVSIVAQSVRQKEKLGDKVSLETKAELLSAVKNKKSHEAQQITAQILELPVLRAEKMKTQADDSVRLEMSLSSEEMATLKKARELLGHIKPGMSLKELFILMAEKTIHAKDPGQKVQRESKRKNGNENEKSVELSSASEWKASDKNQGSSQMKTPHQDQEIPEQKGPHRIDQGRMSTSLREEIFLRDQCCQWVDPLSGRKCEGRHLLEVDHIIPRWAGGKDCRENLTLLCRAHNQFKYQKESGIRST